MASWKQSKYCLIFRFCFGFVLALSVAGALSTYAYDPEDYEEPAGASFIFQINPEDGIYGIGGGSGTWLRGTPVFGDYFLTLFSNEIEDTAYSGVGMTLRIMPHWTAAPFIGVGGSYNFSLSQSDTSISNEVTTVQVDSGTSTHGESYWAGHVEAGIRFWFSNRLQLLELMVRQTYSSLDGDHDYWLVGISTGVGI